MSPLLRSVAEHREHVLSHVVPAEPVERETRSALGSTLRADATAGFAVPPFTNSSMDGFAVVFDEVSRAATTAPVRLDVVADVPAGVDDNPPLAAGQAIRIMTGAPLPTAADTIVPFEDTAGGLADSLGEITVLTAPSHRGAFVRRAGEDVAVGDVVLAAGTLLGPRQVASLVATGVRTVLVSPRPRVAVLSTGSELVEAGLPLAHGQIPDTNGDLLAGLARDAGADIITTSAVPDDPAALERQLERVLGEGADVICFSGGVSAGAYEVVRTVLGPSKRMEFSHVTMQPGKPQGFGVTDGGCLLFGLPGNPISSAVSFEAFVRPALMAMQGRSRIERPHQRLQTSSAWDSPAGREQHVPIVVDRTDPGAWTVAPATDRGSQSHLIGTLGLAEGLAIVPAATTRVEVGDWIDVVALP